MCWLNKILRLDSRVHNCWHHLPPCLWCDELECKVLLAGDLVLSFSILFEDTLQDIKVVVLSECEKEFLCLDGLLGLLRCDGLALGHLLQCGIDSEHDSKGILPLRFMSGRWRWHDSHSKEQMWSLTPYTLFTHHTLRCIDTWGPCPAESKMWLPQSVFHIDMETAVMSTTSSPFSPVIPTSPLSSLCVKACARVSGPLPIPIMGNGH